MTTSVKERLGPNGQAPASGRGLNGRRRNKWGGLKIGRVYTTKGVHPYDEVAWERRDVVMTNWRDGKVNFEQLGVEFPSFWSQNATNIVASKYFRGELKSEQRELDSERREWSLKQLINRVVGQYMAAGRVNGYFATAADAEVFEHELTYMLLHQIFSFNSPVWFNIGATSLNRETQEWELVPQQVSACFILSVDDTLDSIGNWIIEEQKIFKGGSGSGLNLSRVRGSQERLSMGGQAGGPLCFMRSADASAGSIRSGGSTRRAAKMVVLDVDHPDIEEFVNCKADQEPIIRALRDSGYDMDLDGKHIHQALFQNANNSVRVTDRFMEAVENDGEFGLTARLDGHVMKTVRAKELFRQMAEAAWLCADPGVQYDGTIQHWHTCPNAGRISASNPCSEYMHLDNSSCNLASLNLMKFLRDDGTFDADTFVRATEIIIMAMDISICFADFPTEKITEVSRQFRQLGIGYANLGALLMATGHAYDSDGGRALAAAITSLMTAVSYRRSAELAGVVGAYEGYKLNAGAHQRVMRQHAAANDQLVVHGADDGAIRELAGHEWDAGNALGAEFGWRNAQASLLAPTGTIGLMMDCDTTGIEPDLALVKHKKLVGGGSMQIVNQTVPRALAALGYGPEECDAILAYVSEYGHVVGAPHLAEEHYEVFDCAMGDRSILPMGHVQMMAAVQPFLSGAISKTVNLPESATVEDIEQVYLEGWRLGLKAMAVYRDNCKVGQPLSVAGSKKTVPGTAVAVPTGPVRNKLPKQRRSRTTSFSVGEAEGYLTVGEYPDGTPGEIFVKLGKQGSTLAGVMDAFSLSISVGLQHGIPLEFYVVKFFNSRFEPAGMTDDPDLRMATSIIDYLFRRLALDYLPYDTRIQLGILSAKERAAQVALDYGVADEAAVKADADAGFGDYDVVNTVAVRPPAAPAVVATAPVGAAGNGSAAHNALELRAGKVADAPLCMTCGTKMRPAGSCYVCEGCGSTSGCS